MKTCLTGFAIVLSMLAAFPAQAQPRCFEQADAMAKGMLSAFRAFHGSSRIQSLTLESLTDEVEYSLTIDFDGSLESYKINLDNDSHSRCLPLSINMTQSGG